MLALLWLLVPFFLIIAVVVVYNYVRSTRSRRSQQSSGSGTNRPTFKRIDRDNLQHPSHLHYLEPEEIEFNTLNDQLMILPEPRSCDNLLENLFRVAEMFCDDEECEFSHRRGVLYKIYDLLQNARKSIDICQFSMTHPGLVLVSNLMRETGLPVRIITNNPLRGNQREDIQTDRFTPSVTPQITPQNSPPHPGPLPGFANRRPSGRHRNRGRRFLQARKVLLPTPLTPPLISPNQSPNRSPNLSPIQSPHHLPQQQQKSLQNLDFRKFPFHIRHNTTDALMHNKFVILDKMIVLHGSANWTFTAFNRNDEIIKLETKPEIVKQFVDLFENLWTRYESSSSYYPLHPDQLQPGPSFLTENKR